MDSQSRDHMLLAALHRAGGAAGSVRCGALRFVQLRARASTLRVTLRWPVRRGRTGFQ